MINAKPERATRNNKISGSAKEEIGRRGKERGESSHDESKVRRTGEGYVQEKKVMFVASTTRQ
jgi:hypothetical protein